MSGNGAQSLKIRSHCSVQHIKDRHEGSSNEKTELVKNFMHYIETILYGCACEPHTTQPTKNWDITRCA
jgi:hypothetical protein